MKGRANATLSQAALTGLLLTAVLVASVVACPVPLARPGATAAAHHHGSEASTSTGVEPHPELSLRAPCTCGCDTSGADATASRLPFALLVAACDQPEAAVQVLQDNRCDAAPESPGPLIEHVPRCDLA